MGKVWSALWSVVPVCVTLVFCSQPAYAGKVFRKKFESGGRYLIVEILDNKTAHFELSAVGKGPAESDEIATTPMVLRKEFPGPTEFRMRREGRAVFQTPEMVIEVDETSLCVSLEKKDKGQRLTELCPLHLDQYWKGFTFTRGTAQNFYGLGQEFRTPGEANGDWKDSVRHFGGIHGNKMVPFNGGMNGNTQVPILYAVGEGKNNYALFLDQVYQQQWDFLRDPSRVEMYGDQIRWYFILGDSLPELRKAYLDLVGRPLVPPRKAFGLWLSEYGYRNWDHVENTLASLRNEHFPIDGFYLDLYWFGGIIHDSENSSMGSLRWDPKAFPNAEATMTRLKEKEGVGIIPIEESYISKGLPEHRKLDEQGFLVKNRSGQSAYLTESTWWGKGGMIDWTNLAGTDFWHDWRRAPLIAGGVTGMWLDLGEPEIFPGDAVYAGGMHQADVHNLYNFKWSESVYRGFRRTAPNRRPFMMSRSGAAGIQRFGAAMWSGDIGSDLSSLAAHQNVQMHMSLSGIDYFGSDIGGFHRGALQGDPNEMYTQWFAYGMLFDIPGRPHTENLCQCKPTSPVFIGDKASNLENARLRYRLIPYVYSLAHRAYLEGEPVFPPLVYSFQNDPMVRHRGQDKMIGPYLLAATVAKNQQKETEVYLPAGRWVDFHRSEWVVSRGEFLKNISLYPEGKFRLPLYLRAGAIVPMMHVDEKTMNSFGRRTDGTVRSELILKVVADATPSSFTLYEDDGESTGYERGEVRSTTLSQSSKAGVTTVSISAGRGVFPGAISHRDHHIELIQDQDASEVSLNGESLPRFNNKAEWEAAERGWYSESNHRHFLKTGVRTTSESITLLVK